MTADELRHQTTELCARYGAMLIVPGHLIGTAVMYAIASNESSLGTDTTPRHEPLYDFHGKYAADPEQAALLQRYGSAAAYSYGPWQILPCNAPGFTIDQLKDDPQKSAEAFVSFFNRYVIRDHFAGDLNQIGQVYNAGHVFKYGPPPPGVQRYVNDLRAAYANAPNLAQAVAAKA